jgi:hypothetical protein
VVPVAASEGRGGEGGGANEDNVDADVVVAVAGLVADVFVDVGVV